MITINSQTNSGVTGVSPPSPTLSCASVVSSKSWMQKNPNELIPMLKNAYDILKDKERDLRLAAEIGRSLLENNKALKSNYEDLLNTPYPTPTNSSSLIETKIDDEKMTGEAYEYVPANRTREAMLEILEYQNSDLSQQLETALLKQENLDRKNSKKARQLEMEVKFLQTSLDHATQKIQELEEARIRKTLTYKDGNTVDETNQQKWIDENCVSKQVDLLKAENDQLSQAKTEMEKKLCASLNELHLLQQQYEQFQFTTKDYEKLKQAFETQNIHIQELKSSLEEHRHIVSKLRDRGIYIPSSSSTTSSETHKRKVHHDTNKNNLLTELENAWFKHQSPPRSRQTSISSYIQPSQPIYPSLNVDSALESIILKAGVVEKDALDDALSLLGRLEDEYDHEKFLQEKRHIYYKQDNEEKVQVKEESIYSYYYEEEPEYVVQVRPTPSGIIGYAKYAIESIIQLIWRWVRFTLVMMIAVFISLKEGPDGL
ncbi:uncharacterized protein EV154DRAFT_526020 [Mucor mucedo]|uniref:uncharacterized protein n=1 Tax=Mucor mucedo TaxID=29922 RepID=UPI00221FFF2D|nr:uncharacterized protein EV154DRAFT_526020 [Mucor mucedo]KAI7876505.1 hypothetical protein EV154DRAFT_526020 [Mucor mucedo]